MVRHDEDDYYLVVAADKGTATFSDIANEISQEYGHWLGDAFASGGSVGYDHKKMGITARGAWESVKRHFREIGVNCQTTDFTCVGIGDMAGDVFGNGMLLSEHTQLVGAFNHMHIFIDPTPDAAKSFVERQRLFELPGSSWDDYNRELISVGGGIFLRSAKSIKLSPQIQTLLGTDKASMAPNELIKALLCLNVDLLWNGGIGTYVKSARESDADVGIAATTCCGSMAVICVPASWGRVATLASPSWVGWSTPARAVTSTPTLPTTWAGWIAPTTRSTSRYC